MQHEWWNTSAAAWGILLLGIGGGVVLTYLSPIIGIPVGVIISLLGIVLIFRAYRHKKQSKPLRLSNRKELIRAIHQVKETANEAITTSNMLNQLHKIGKEPPQPFVADFSNAFDRYQEALKGLEREALIAGEVFHNPINSFFVKINSCVQKPIRPINQPDSTMALVNPPENTIKLNDAMNEVVREIDDILSVNNTK
jgi:hypothetical protein